MQSIAVIGAGIVGLSSAVCIQETLPTARVTVIADTFTVDTTSEGAAGMFRPILDLVPGVSDSLLRKWINDSWKRYDGLAKSEDSSESGVCFLSGYHMYDTGKSYTKKPNILEDVVYHHRHISDEEHKMFGCRRRQNGVFFTTFLIESHWHLPWLTKKFLENGGQIIKRTVKSFEEFVGQYDVVVNCTGLRANELQPDSNLEPNRGQVLRVKAPWIKHFIYVDNECWIIPGQEWVVVGGTRQANNANTNIDKQDLDDVWSRACAAIPSLKNAEIMKIWPGLRPYRKPLRLEVEKLSFKGRHLMVVHNYGHGGNGIGLSWGTAVHATELVTSVLSNQPRL